MLFPVIAWYDIILKSKETHALKVVVPSYRLVWYNDLPKVRGLSDVVVPSYRLVWYNQEISRLKLKELLFPVIAWYDIIRCPLPRFPFRLLFPVIAWYDIIVLLFILCLALLLFPVIAWYDIIVAQDEADRDRLLFPVIAWYDIIKQDSNHARQSCCSQLSLGMI